MRRRAAGRSGIVTIANDSVDGPEGVLARLLDGANSGRIGGAGLAAPVSGEEIALTNRNWCVRLTELSARFGIAAIHAVNDFEALAWALPHSPPTICSRSAKAAHFPTV